MQKRINDRSSNNGTNLELMVEKDVEEALKVIRSTWTDVNRERL